ncbi:MAG: hypothetical protein J7599_16980 [Niabella sp.]|nr:hypothetical protein [Niabella sp.]
MKQLFDPLFLGYGLAWGLIHGFRWAGAPIPFLNSYLTDFIFVPTVAHIALRIIRVFVVQNETYRIPPAYLLFIALYTSVVFEGIMPAVAKTCTRDAGDVLAYFAGACFYYSIHQSRLRDTYRER